MNSSELTSNIYYTSVTIIANGLSDTSAHKYEPSVGCTSSTIEHILSCAKNYTLKFLSIC